MLRLKLLRESKNMTQLRLGMKLGVSQETISGYEIGKTVPPADMLVKLADTLNTSVDYLLGRTDDQHFNPLQKSDLSSHELELLELYKSLPNHKQQMLIGIIIGLQNGDGKPD